MLVGFQMVVLIAFAVAALVHVGNGDAPAGLAFDLDWFNPFTGLALSAFVIGVTGSIFAFWGWDTCLTLGEESKDPTKVPGRAGLLCVLSILLTYLLVAVAVMMYAGVGEAGLGLGNAENADNVFGALADPVLGTWAGPLLFLAVLRVVGGQPADHLPARRPRDAGDGRLRRVPEELRRSQPALPGAGVRHRRRRRGHRRSSTPS